MIRQEEKLLEIGQRKILINMKKLENLNRGDLKELKEELENLYEAYEVEELDNLIKCCKSQIMNKSNINLLDIIGKTLYSGKEDEYPHARKTGQRSALPQSPLHHLLRAGA